MAIQIVSSPVVYCCITWETKQMQHEIKKKEKTSVNLIITDT